MRCGTRREKVFSFNQTLVLQSGTQAEFVVFPLLSHEETDWLEYYYCRMKYAEMKTWDNRGDEWAL